MHVAAPRFAKSVASGFAGSQEQRVLPNIGVERLLALRFKGVQKPGTHPEIVINRSPLNSTPVRIASASRIEAGGSQSRPAAFRSLSRAEAGPRFWCRSCSTDRP